MTNDIKVCNGSSFEEHRFFSVGHNFYFSPALSLSLSRVHTLERFWSSIFFIKQLTLVSRFDYSCATLLFAEPLLSSALRNHSEHVYVYVFVVLHMGKISSRIKKNKLY